MISANCGEKQKMDYLAKKKEEEGVWMLQMKMKKSSFGIRLEQNLSALSLIPTSPPSTSTRWPSVLY